jgi:hypothetical protein
MTDKTIENVWVLLSADPEMPAVIRVYVDEARARARADLDLIGLEPICFAAPRLELREVKITR